MKFLCIPPVFCGKKQYSPRNLMALLTCLTAFIAGVSAFGQVQQGRMHNPHGSLNLDCLNCHTDTSWAPIRPAPDFSHNETGFPLRGLHQDVDCGLCHVSPVFAEVGKECSDCHADIHRDRLGRECEKCHTVLGWTERLQIVQNHKDKFPFTGAHSTASCNMCHKAGAKLSAECVSCHVEDYESTKAPNHGVVNLPQTCETCHQTDGWRNGNFDHTLYAGFDLTGAHASRKCAACHAGGNFTGRKADCITCHENNFVGATIPNHIAAGFSRECSQCHNTNIWFENSFNHQAATGFTLSGIHATLTCDVCHSEGKYKELSQDCYQCHSEDYALTKSPDHAKSDFSNNCVQCHKSDGWRLVQVSQVSQTFDHSTTGFTLTGSHSAQNCSSCHVGDSGYGSLANTCISCHQENYSATTNPNHQSASFQEDCTLCHNTTQWQGAVFNHDTGTEFPLTGIHAFTSCEQCHVNNVYQGLSSDCISCHSNDYDNTKNPNHGDIGISQDCTMCHTPFQWSGARFEHNAGLFPLSGAHTTLECSSCHQGGVYQGTPQDCVSCHLNDYVSTVDPDHEAALFSQTCGNCHNTTTWADGTFDHTVSAQFPLTGSHTAIACSSCHQNGVYQGTSQDCVSCHLSDYTATINPDHESGGYSQDCSVCHMETQWMGADFNHNTEAAFPLTGAHQTANCSQCHQNGVYQGMPQDCVSCHLNDYVSTVNPDHETAQFSQTCGNCHRTASWSGGIFDHAALTQFPLTGSHTTLDCTSCHQNEVYQGTSQDCVSCHLNDYTATINPDHETGEYSQDCSVCHTETQWVGADFNHNMGTAFPLTGAHETANCNQCHQNGVYQGTPQDCVSCHLNDYVATLNPDHEEAQFSQTCSDCHSTASWLSGTFNHAISTQFPLTGSHTAVACSSCHQNGVYQGTSQDCVSCHLSDYAATINPDHEAAGYSQDCSVCHTETQWTGADFNHSTEAAFPLTGAHESANCSQCHQNGVYRGTPQDCVFCHLNDYNATLNPDHEAAQFSQPCTSCHSTTSWLGGTFDHTASTQFPLTGSHTTVACTSCHQNGVYQGTSQDCVACHLSDYTATLNPDHEAAGYSQDCSVCHTETQWMGADFNHSTEAAFPLTGAHESANCSQCHQNGVYQGTPQDCVSCHLNDYNATLNPDHEAAQFSQTCTSCHSTASWLDGTFNHTASTQFPLTGSHSAVACSSCHQNGVYQGTSQDCVSCHLNDYTAAADPAHGSAGFPQDCTICHNTATWLGGTFDHTASTQFPLTGSHTTVACSSCHQNGVYQGTPQDCISCHLSDYTATLNPDHEAAQFSQTCTSCHSTASWLGGTFDHTASTQFPLTGSHTTVACTSCHQNGVYQGTPQDCVSCHLSDYAATINPDHEAAGYSQDCSVCHTETQWVGADFNHNAESAFPLTGAHETANCSQCHQNGVYQSTPQDCVSCHLNDYTATSNPDHEAAQFSQICTSCHSTASWLGGTFDHTASTQFPLTGSHTAVACSNCHQNSVYQGTSQECVSCHLSDYTAAVDPDHGSAGFPQNCTICHNTASWSGGTFNHTASTQFPLTGSHTAVACSSCHQNGVYQGTPQDCISCHLNDYVSTVNPDHEAAQFSQTCTSCHSTASWLGGTFDHTASTQFPLTGSHTAVACSNCHQNSVYQGTSQECVSCHLSDYTAAVDPDHGSAGFPQDCTICHNTASWLDGTFNHTASTQFPLTGSHTTVACTSCHQNGVYQGTPQDCVSCHLNDYTATLNPDHEAAQFSQTCSDCHSTASWLGGTFDHTASTQFPLTGSHTAVACSNCHQNGVYQGTSQDCVSCHLSDYTAAVDPAHGSAGFPQDCTICHNTSQWTGANFNHDTTGYILTGAHAEAECILCHENNVFAGTPSQCSSCHLTDYNGTVNPDHAAAGFPQDCSICHSTTAWLSGTFDHTTSTQFPLTGAHNSLGCSSCHSEGIYAGLDQTCVSCHLGSYNSTQNPDHAASGFPQDCAVCHTTAGWTPAGFDHSSLTSFTLTGAHTTVSCASCHIGGQYAGTPTSCYACHQSLYNETNNPNHTAAEFPTTCETCHTTTQWTGATFNHTWFPEDHRSANTCSDCHPNSSNYTIFNCLGCHTKSQTDSHHSGISNYAYNSANCYSCHPTGRN